MAAWDKGLGKGSRAARFPRVQLPESRGSYATSDQCGAEFRLRSIHRGVTLGWGGTRLGVGRSPGNAADTASNCYSANCGSVTYTFVISKYDTTNEQYAAFLNAVDPNGSNALGLYNTNMATDQNNGGISFVSGNPSGSKYMVKTAGGYGGDGFANKPVVYVSFFSALRFANWLNNGRGSGSTETGAYTLLGGTPTPTNGLTVTRNAGATIFLPSENEWYKAAYYNPATSRYFAYPAGTSAPTVCAAPGVTPNAANCGNAVEKLTNVGGYTGSASPYGSFDQGGNVLQWNEEGDEPTSIARRRGIRGGSWNYKASALAASSLNYGAPSYEGPDAGFRVASLGDQCEHTSSDEKLQAAIAASYCLAFAHVSPLHTFAVQRCYAPENTCAAACRASGSNTFLGAAEPLKTPAKPPKTGQRRWEQS